MKWITQFKQENVFPKKIDNWLSQKSEQFYIFFENVQTVCKVSVSILRSFYIPFVTFIAILELISLFGLFQNVQSTPK